MIPICKPQLGVEEIAAATGVLNSGQLAQGPYVEAFEHDWANVCQAQHCVAVTNGTVALRLMLEAYNFIPGSEIITSPFTFWGTIEAIVQARLVPVFADIDPRTYNLDPEQTRKAITNKTVAILPVHLYGLEPEMERFQDIANEYELELLADMCQAHGLPLKANAAAFSFYATKNITTGGEGGAIVTNDGLLDKRLRHLCNHWNTGDYRHISVGYNARMTEVQAAIGVEQIKKLSTFNAARKANAEFYDTHLRYGIKPTGLPHVYHHYTIRVDRRTELCECLKNNDIGYGIYYPIPCHKQGYLAYRDCSLPMAEYAAEHVVSLPVHPGLTEEERAYIAETINRDF